MARLLPSIRTERSESDTAEPASSARRTPDPKTVVLGCWAFAAGALVGSRLGRAGTRSSGTLRERAGAALPGDAVDVPIGGRDEGGTGDEGGAGDGGDTDDEGPAGDTDGQFTGATNPSLEEVDERTGPDVGEEPAEPGLMQVDEELLEEAGGETAEDETADGETADGETADETASADEDGDESEE